MWDDKDTGFHQPLVLPDLLTHESTFLTKPSRVFVPLCGKTVDLVYLADKGHDVYGCEFIESAVKDFFTEQSLEYTTSMTSDMSTMVYKAVSKKITLYCGDFFALKSKDIGKFDGIWDRASLVAVEPSQREEYGKVMKDLMSSGGKYLLNSYIITGEKYKGPPHSVPIDDIEKCFGSFCEIKQLDSRSDMFPLANIEAVQIVNSLLTSKF